MLIDQEIQKSNFKTKLSRRNSWVPNMTKLFFHLLLMFINYWGMFSRSHPSLLCFILPVCTKKPIQYFFFCKLLPLIASWSQLIATYCSCFAEVIEYDFIECAGWSDWCVLPIICNSKHFNLFVFYFNVSNKISSTKPRLLKEANLFPLTVLISQK